jgi:predicted Zn-dependent protease
VNVQHLARQVLERAVAASPGADVEVSVDHSRPALTRFANSVIHQNVAEEHVRIGVRVHVEGRTASASSTVTGEDGLDGLVSRVLAAASLAPLDPGWPGVAPPAPLGDMAPVDAATRDASPDDRAVIVADFVAAAGGMETAGYCRTNHRHGAFANSAGHAITSESADVALAGIARRTTAGGVVDGVARLASSRLRDVDGARLGARAGAKANAAADPVELPPDRYEVVLEPTAVADLLEAFSMYGFNAKAVKERRSFVRLGDAQFDPAITLVDDAPAAGIGYDADGAPTQRLVLVDAGTTVGLIETMKVFNEVKTEHEGRIERIVAQNGQLVQAGDLLVAPEGVPHGVRNSGTERLLVLAILAPAP